MISTGNDGYLVFLYEQTLVFEMRNQTALQRVAKILHYLLNSFRSLNANSQYQARHPLAEVIKTLTFVLGICKSIDLIFLNLYIGKGLVFILQLLMVYGPVDVM